MSARRFAVASAFAIVLISGQAIGATAGATTNSSLTQVKGHVTKKGKYVKSHRRTKPDKRLDNNWSAKGKVNPYTGEPGQKASGSP